MRTEQADEQLQKDVQDGLHNAPDLDVSDIGVTVERGVVTLDGHVSGAAEHQAVEAIARLVPGVRAVVDDLDVRPPGTPVYDQRCIMARESVDALDRRAGGADERIQVIVHDGRVRLEGIVGSPGEKEAAEAAIGDLVIGWGAVENAIVVRPTSPLEPAEVGPKDVRWCEDDFDTLQIDPSRGNGAALESRAKHLWPGHNQVMS